MDRESSIQSLISGLLIRKGCCSIQQSFTEFCVHKQTCCIIHLDIVYLVASQLLWRQQDVLVSEKGWANIVQLWEEVASHALKSSPVFGGDAIPHLQENDQGQLTKSYYAKAKLVSVTQ